jgi:hypothetical protein
MTHEIVEPELYSKGNPGQGWKHLPRWIIFVAHGFSHNIKSRLKDSFPFGGISPSSRVKIDGT